MLPIMTKERILWALIAAVSSALHGVHAVMLKLSVVNGRIPFKSAAIVLFSEVGKLIISLVMWALTSPNTSKLPNATLSLVFYRLPMSMLPACLYALNNNIIVYQQRWLDPISIQVLGNLKIPATVLMYVVLLQRDVGKYKLAAVVLVTCASVLNGFAGQPDGRHEEHLRVTLAGFLLSLVLAFSSATESVYNEKIVSRQKGESIHAQNTCLYVCGSVINLVSLLVNGGGGIPTLSGPSDAWQYATEGFSGLAWLIVISQISSGLLMSVVLKHGNNLLRIMIVGCAVPINMALSIVIFSLHVPPWFFIALPILILALISYNLPPPQDRHSHSARLKVS